MYRRRFAIAGIGALLLALPLAADAQGSTRAPVKESGSPINDQGSNYNYRSNITRVIPSTPGVSLQVLEFADRLLLTNHSGQTVTVYGYQGEPYARVLADGTVQLNTRSPAYYLNQNFYANVNVPPSASPTATPQWTVIDRTGQLEWHDHRIHWMSPALPPQVKDKGKRTKIFNWQVPIQVGASKGTVNGELFWTPESGTKTPTGAIVALAVIALLGLLFVLFIRRRRSGATPGPSAGEPGGESGSPVREAW
jgi:hypothetical protein